MRDAGGSILDIDSMVSGNTAVNITAGGALILSADSTGSFGSSTIRS
jgi:hypothetical protein